LKTEEQGYIYLQTAAFRNRNVSTQWLESNFGRHENGPVHYTISYTHDSLATGDKDKSSMQNM